jgi:hypothetical protein
MSKTKESLTSLLTIVAFLALTAIAAVLYGGNTEQKAQMENNFFWQKTRWALDLAFAIVPAFINPQSNQDQNAGSSRNASGDYPYNPGSEFAVPDSSGGFWSDLVARLKAEWAKGVAEGTKTDFNNSGSTDFQNNLDVGRGAAGIRFFDWQKTEAGTEIIFRRQNGQEYKLLIPFRLFGSK